MSQQYYPPPPGPPPPQQQQQQGYAPPPAQGYPPPPPQQGYASPPQQQPQQYFPPPSAPPQQHPQQSPAAPSTQWAATAQPIHGQWPREGPPKLVYAIDHRDCNTLLTVNFCDPTGQTTIKAKPGAMVGMSHTIMLEGNIKFSFKKMITGSEMSESTYRGKGEVLLAPSALGDIVPIRITGDAVWSVGKDAFLACTEGLKKDSKSQGISKAIFSGEGLFVFKFTAADNAKKEGGILWVTSLGAIVLKELKAGEQFFIDNNHLVAWDTKYTVERVASGGVLSGMAASEGVACRFTGPGKVFFQTRNPVAFGQWIQAHSMQGQA